MACICSVKIYCYSFMLTGGGMITGGGLDTGGGMNAVGGFLTGGGIHTGGCLRVNDISYVPRREEACHYSNKNYPDFIDHHALEPHKQHCSNDKTTSHVSPITMQNHAIDSWIDTLDPYYDPYTTLNAHGSLTQNSALQWLTNQHLPKLEVKCFAGNSECWVEFVISFKEVIHQQEHLTGAQRMSYLLQYVSGEAERCIQVYSKDWYGYTMAWKRLKYMFGQRASVARAVISKVTNGKQVSDDDMCGLVDFYYAIGDCLVTLTRLDYTSDLNSTNILCQAISRLPNRLQGKWAERSFTIRAHAEPTLRHLEAWLRDRIMAARDPYLPISRVGKWKQQVPGKKPLVSFATTSDSSHQEHETRISDDLCHFCSKEHKSAKCPLYLKKTPLERYEVARKAHVCFNCFGLLHSSNDCESSTNCSSPGCGGRHHDTLHESFMARKKESQKKKSGKEKKNGTEEKKEEDSLTMASTTMHLGPREVYLQVVPVRVVGSNGREVETHAILDGCSQATLIRDDISDAIGLG